jgi:hypothetical protein
MKKFYRFFSLLVFMLIPFLISLENNTSEYLRVSYRVPRKYGFITKEGVPGEFFVSPGIILSVGEDKWQHCAAWWETRKGPLPMEDKKFAFVIKTGFSGFKMWEKVIIEYKDDLVLFTEADSNLVINRRKENFLKEIFKNAYEIDAEYLHCVMDFQTMKKILLSEKFTIILKSGTEKTSFDVAFEKEWQGLLEKKD